MNFFILGLLLISMTTLMTKWKGSLSVIVILEMSSLLTLSTLYLSLSGTGFTLILVMIFLVGEALILLAAFYGSLQVAGVSHGFLNLL